MRCKNLHRVFGHHAAIGMPVGRAPRDFGPGDAAAQCVNDAPRLGRDLWSDTISGQQHNLHPGITSGLHTPSIQSFPVAVSSLTR